MLHLILVSWLKFLCQFNDDDNQDDTSMHTLGYQSLNIVHYKKWIHHFLSQNVQLYLDNVSPDIRNGSSFFWSPSMKPNNRIIIVVSHSHMSSESNCADHLADVSLNSAVPVQRRLHLNFRESLKWIRCQEIIVLSTYHAVCRFST